MAQNVSVVEVINTATRSNGRPDCRDAAGRTDRIDHTSVGRLVWALCSHREIDRRTDRMNTGLVDGYMKARKGLAIAGLTAIMLGGTLGGVLADGTFGDPKKLDGDGYSEYSLKSSTYAVTAGDTLYQYGTGEDGNAYYTTYDGEAWSNWESWGEQPAKYVSDPAPVVYNDKAYSVYKGEDDKYYFGGDDWTDISGTHTFKWAPWANTYDEKLYAYGTDANDSYVYWVDYDGAEWGKWGNISEEYTSNYSVYAIDWDGYNNVFWTDADGTTYWNRYDGTAWSGAKALPGDYKVKSAVWAHEYDGDLYAVGTGDKGESLYNVFDGDGWSGWAALDGDYAAKDQPAAYVCEDALQIVYTADDGNAYHYSYDGEWSEAQDLGKGYAYDPYLYNYNDGCFLTYTSDNGYAYVKQFAGGEDGY